MAASLAFTEVEAEVRASARAHGFDRYLAALLSPADVRDDLIALAATLGEIARVPALVTEPMMGEIRLTWWRDELAKPADAAPSGHPVADAMRSAIARARLPADLFEQLIEARVMDLYADPVQDGRAVEAYCDATAGAGFRLAARILGVDRETDAAALTAGGRAYGLANILATLPQARHRGRDPLPADWGDSPSAKLATAIDRARAELAVARRELRGARRPVMAATLPVALVEPYLRALQRPGHDPWMTPTDISPLTRVWRLWRTHVVGRV